MKIENSIIVLILFICLGCQNDLENRNVRISIPTALYFHPEVKEMIEIIGNDEDVKAGGSWNIVIDKESSFDIKWKSFSHSSLKIFIPEEFEVYKNDEKEVVLKKEKTSLELFLLDTINVEDDLKYLISEFNTILYLCESNSNCFYDKKIANILESTDVKLISSLFREVRNSKPLQVLGFLGVCKKELIYCRYEAPYDKNKLLENEIIFSSILNHIKHNDEFITPSQDRLIKSSPIAF